MFALGLWFFNREAPRISENLYDERNETSTSSELAGEIERLRARVDALEAELVEVQARANAPWRSGRSAPTGSSAGTSTSTR